LAIGLRKELKEKFLEEFTPSERAFFLNRAREAVNVKRYRPSEDLFHYCYFLTMRERLRAMGAQRGEGYARVLLIEGMKDVEEALRLYEERLEAGKLPEGKRSAEKFIEFLSG
jgi:hypothetical protein